MKEIKPECHPICMLAHQLMNSLSVIVACCDFLTPADQPQDDHHAKYVEQIRDTAKSMARMLSAQQCNLAVLARCEALEENPHKGRPS